MRRTILIIIGISAVIYLAANLEIIQKAAIGFGARYLKDEFDLDLTVGKIRGNLFHHLELTDIRIGPVSEIKRLEVSYNPFSIVGGRFRINNITITGVTVNVDQALKVKPKTKKETGPLAIDIDRLLLDSGIIRYQKRNIPLSLSLSYLNNRIEINDLICTLPNSRIITRGCFNSEGNSDISYQINLDLADLDLGEGKIESRGRVSGPGKSPVAKGRGGYSSINMPRIGFNYRYEAGRIHLDDLTVLGRGLDLAGGVTYDLKEEKLTAGIKGRIGTERLSVSTIYRSGRIRAEISGKQWAFLIKGIVDERVDLTLTGNYLQNPIRGRLTYGKKQLDGEIVAESPPLAENLSIKRITTGFNLSFIGKKPNGRVRIKVKGINYSDNKLGNLALKINLRDDHVKIMTSGLISGKGRIGIKPPNPILFNFALNDFDLSGLFKDGTGRLDLKVGIQGTLTGRRGPDLSVVIKKLSAVINQNEIAVADPLKIHYANSETQVEQARFYINGSRVTIAGTIGDNLNFHLSTHDFDLSTLSAILPDESISGRLDADINLSGHISEPKFRGSVNLDQLLIATVKDTIGPAIVDLKLNNDSIAIANLAIHYHDISIYNNGIIGLVLKRKFVRIQKSRIKIDNNLISFGGKIPIGGGPEMAIMIKTDSLDLSTFSNLIPDLDLAGFISVTVNLKGSLPNPEIFGQARIDSTIVIVNKDTIGPINGDIEFVKDYARFENLTLAYHEGQVLLNGDLGIGRVGSMTINAEKIKVPIMKRSYADIDAGLTIVGRIDSITVTGEVSISGAYLEPIDAGLIIQTNRPAREPSAYLKKINLDLGLNLDFQVKTTIADLILSGDLQIKGTAAGPGLTGRVKIEQDGTIGYLGKKFKIEQGVIDLVDPRKISPVLDIIASTTITYQDINYSITLSIAGPPEKLLISLDSDPYLPEQEIIALLVTGKTRGMMRMPTAKEVGSKAAEYLISKIKEDIEKRTARALGLERITVSGPVSRPESVRIAIEKKIKTRVKVSYSTGFENWEQQKVGLDYELNRNFSIYSTYDLENRDAGGGLDLHLRLW